MGSKMVMVPSLTHHWSFWFKNKEGPSLFLIVHLALFMVRPGQYRVTGLSLEGDTEGSQDTARRKVQITEPFIPGANSTPVPLVSLIYDLITFPSGLLTSMEFLSPFKSRVLVNIGYGPSHLNPEHLCVLLYPGRRKKGRCKEKKHFPNFQLSNELRSLRDVQGELEMHACVFKRAPFLNHLILM